MVFPKTENTRNLCLIGTVSFLELSKQQTIVKKKLEMAGINGIVRKKAGTLKISDGF